MQATNIQTGRQRFWPAQNWVAFTLITILMLWVVHAVVLFSHEYAHSFTAWLLGWKANPLALHYGQLTTGNVLVQGQVDENVDYTPIFAGGHGIQAGIIAAAGMVIGNGFITYPISLYGYYAAKKRGLRTPAMVFYWMCVASIGNFIDYVPVRTFSFREDMHTLASGFNCSPWLIIVFLGIPFAIATLHFFAMFAPRALQWLFPASAARRAIIAFLTAFAVFGFYGAAGWGNSGPVSHTISVISVCVFAPVIIVVLWWLTGRAVSKANA